MTRRELLTKAGVATLATRIGGFLPPIWASSISQPSLAAFGLTSPPPDPLVFRDGRAVSSINLWASRRKEILELATSQMYGVAPTRSAHLRFEILEKDGIFFNGIATRRQVRIYFEGKADGPSADLLLYLPRHRRPAPVVLGMNFWGNHTVSLDPAILLNKRWAEQGKNIFIDLSCVQDHRATEACRGIDARRWPIEEILKRGYGVATLCRLDIDRDLPDDFSTSLRAVYPELQQRGDNFSVIGAWAWALSRALDYLETDRHVDQHRIAVYGWSRLGKAAVWSGACDPRFAAILSQESGAGGVKLFRRGVGENIRRLNTVFPHWYCHNFRQYNDKDCALPFDQHLVIAAIAPRPIHIASAVDDQLSDPPGEFLSGALATSVYSFLGSSGLPVKEMPPINTAVFGQISYHIRSGSHDVTDFDWEQYLHFLDHYL